MWSPEACAGGPVGFPSDVWSLGIMFAMGVCACCGFVLLTIVSQFLSIAKQEPVYIDHDPLLHAALLLKLLRKSQSISNDAKAMISDMLEQEPCKRPSASALLSYPFLARIPLAPLNRNI